MTRRTISPGADRNLLSHFRRRLWRECRVRVVAVRDELWFTRVSPQGYTIGQVVIKVNVCGGLNEYLQAEERACTMLRKSDRTAIRVAGSSSISDAVAAESWPLLWSHLTQTAWEDGTPRVTSSLLLFAGDGSLKIMLRDRSQGLCLWIASPSLSDAFTAIELALGDPNTEWRIDRQVEGEKASRVKPGPGRKR